MICVYINTGSRRRFPGGEAIPSGIMYPPTSLIFLFVNMIEQGLIKDRKEKKWELCSLDGKGADRCAGRVLWNRRGWLNGDPLIAKDRERTATARELGPGTIRARAWRFRVARRCVALRQSLKEPRSGSFMG